MQVERPLVSWIPLSFSQEQMWIMYELDRSSPRYLSPLVHWLRGDLQLDLLVAAMQHIAHSQHSLRTRYGYDNSGAPAQRIIPMEHFVLPTQVLTTADTTMANLLFGADMEVPFDLGLGVVRILSLRVRQTSLYLLTINIHHIATDGVSDEVLHRQLTQVYNLMTQNSENSEFPRAPPVQLTSYAIWQRKCFAELDQLDDHIMWWKQNLANVPVLQLPYRHEHDDEYSGPGGVSIDFPSGFKLRQLFRQCNATDVQGALALWATLLCKLSGQSSVVVGTLYANRGHSQIQTLLGYFINVLGVVLRVADSRKRSFHRFIHETTKVMIQTLGHGEVPYIKVVESALVGVARQLHQATLCQTFLEWYEPNEIPDDWLSGLTIVDQQLATEDGRRQVLCN